MSAALHQDLCSSHIPPGRSRAPADGALSERSAELSAVVLGSQGVLLQTSRLLSELRGKHTQSKQKLWRKWKWSLAAASGIAIGWDRPLTGLSWRSVLALHGLTRLVVGGSLPSGRSEG